jgi:S1-C subfamily serine protease
MPREESPRILSILGLVVAGLLLILYVAIKYPSILRPAGEQVKSGPRTQSDSSAAGSRASRPLDLPRTQASLPEHRELSTQELYQLASPAVVLIEVFDDEGHKRSQGSGFLASEGGSVVTNYHVLRGAYRATAKLADGTTAPITGVVGYDQNRDVAVVQLARPASTFLNLGDSNRIQVGQRVVAIGSPLGLQNTLSEGIVSARRGGLIQMSVPISPGSSGGPILNTEGEVIGIAVSIVVGGQNLNFAVPINWAKNYFGPAAAKPLAQVAAENTVVEQIVSGVMAIPAGQDQAWQVTVDTNKMSNSEVHGQVSSSGGMDGKITLALFYGAQPIFTCRNTYCAIHQDISQPGIYTLILDNRMSPFFSRTVSAQIALRYVR